MSVPYPKPEPRPAKAKTPLKRTALSPGLKRLQPGTKKLKRFTPARQKLEDAKNATYRGLDRPPCCRGCGSCENLSRSHRISQRDRAHIADPENLDVLCGKCHVAYECGSLFGLDNGQEIMAWLAETDWERYAAKCFQLKDRVEEAGLKPEDLPGWVQEILSAF
jgi:hypothetical protein